MSDDVTDEADIATWFNFLIGLKKLRNISNWFYQDLSNLIYQDCITSITFEKYFSKVFE